MVIRSNRHLFLFFDIWFIEDDSTFQCIFNWKKFKETKNTGRSSLLACSKREDQICQFVFGW